MLDRVRSEPASLLWRVARQTSSTVARPAFMSARVRGASAGVVTPFVRQQQPAGAQAASNRGCLHENAVTRDRSAVSLLHLAEQAPAEVVGALSQLVQLDNAERGRPHARKLGEHQSRARLLRFGRRRSDQRLSRTLGVRRSRRNTRGEAEVPRPRRPGAARTPKYHREPFGRGRPPVAARTRHNPSTQSCGMGTAISVRFPNTARNSRSQAPAARWQAGMTSRKPRRYSWSARTDSPLQGLR